MILMVLSDFNRFFMILLVIYAVFVANNLRIFGANFCYDLPDKGNTQLLRDTVNVIVFKCCCRLSPVAFLMIG